MKVDSAFVKEIIEKKIPLHKFLGLELLEIRKGYAKVRVPFRDEVVGDIRLNRWHGGIIASVMDSVGGIAGGTHLTSFEDKIATIDLRIDYLKGAEASALIVDGEIVRLGNRILVTRMSAYQEESMELLAEGKGVYNFIRLKEDKEKNLMDLLEKTNHHDFPG
ncbi:MAG: hotdog fold thioesterase [Flammeovirgaceae bacterium]